MIKSSIFQIIFFCLYYFFTKNIIPFLKIYFKDIPNERSSHKVIKPKAGGIVFVTLSIIIFFLNGNLLFLLSMPLAIIGLIDDYRGLSIYCRLIFQVLISILFLYLGGNIFINSVNGFTLTIISLILIIFFVGIINSYNFMDGIDGLVCSCSAVSLMFYALKYNEDFITIFFILIAFLFFNWSPSKVFMGDIGSTFLGFLSAAILMKSSSYIEFLDIILLSIPLLADAFTCRLRMLICNKNIFTPHKLHLYQRLNQAGLSHQNISYIYALATLFIGISVMFFNIQISIIITLFILLIGVYLDKKVAIDF